MARKVSRFENRNVEGKKKYCWGGGGNRIAFRGVIKTSKKGLEQKGRLEGDSGYREAYMGREI